VKDVYLDASATTLIKPRSVARAMKRAVGTLASPGRGGHSAANLAAEEAYACRETAAKLFNVSDPTQVVFTSSATHGLNIAIKSLVKQGARVVVSGYEHNAVMRPLRASGARVSIARGELFEQETSLFAFETRLEGADCVIINHVSNVFGYVLPVERIAEACREFGIPFIIDASQSAGNQNIDFTALGADFIAMPGHKGLYGPQGTGLLICKKVTSGIMQGGTGSNSRLDTMPDFLPDALEPGTHNMPGIAGLRRGMEFVQKHTPESILAHERKLMRLAAEELKMIRRLHVYYGENPGSVSGVLSFTIDGVDCENVGAVLSEHGIAVRAGLHCAPEAHRSAGTLGSGTVRASVSAFSKERDIDRLVTEVRQIAESLPIRS